MNSVVLVQIVQTWISLAIGYCVVPRCRFGAVGFAAASYLVGTAVVVISAGVYFAVTGRSSFTVILGFAVGIGVLSWRDQAKSFPDCMLSRSDVSAVTATLLGSASLVAWATSAGVGILSPDSIDYLAGADVFGQGLFSVVPADTLQTRMIAMQVLHAPVRMVGGVAATSVSPLAGLAVLALLASLVHRLSVDAVGVPRARILAVLGATVLVSIPWFVDVAFYINAHILVAGLLLFLVGAIAQDSDRSQTSGHFGLALAVSALAIALSRPEGLIVASIALIPLLLTGSSQGRRGAAPFWVLGIGGFLWHSRLWFTQYSEPFDATPFALLGIVLSLGIALLPSVSNWLYRSGVRHARAVIMTLVAAGIVSCLVLYAMSDWEDFAATLDSVWTNLAGAGRWGYGGVGLAMLLVYGLAGKTNRWNGQVKWTIVCLLGFSLCSAFLRGGAFRVGPGDSMNRMFIHFAPLVLLLALTTYGPRRVAGEPSQKGSGAESSYLDRG